jgi:hypothetical protein
MRRRDAIGLATVVLTLGGAAHGAPAIQNERIADERPGGAFVVNSDGTERRFLASGTQAGKAEPEKTGLRAGGVGSAPLIGALYSRWGLFGCRTEDTQIIPTYDDPGVRPRVRLHLAAMHAAGLETLRLGLWHADDTSLGASLIPSRARVLVEPYRTNLIRFLTDIRETGFESLTVSFSPYAANSRSDRPWYL